MIHLPQPPNTFTTLQIPCVACNEVFTIAEAYQGARNRWRLPPDHQPAVQMRYEDNRSRQPIVTARADPRIDPLSFGRRQPDTYINCPRCGADNRNWLQILVSPGAPGGCLSSFLPRGAIIWKQRFPGAYLSIIIGAVLVPITLLMAMAVQDSWGWGLILAAAVFLAAVLTAVDMTRDWISLRLDSHIHNIMPAKQTSQERKLWQRGVMIIFLLSFVIPIVFFLMAPRALGFVSVLLRDTPQTAVTIGNQRLSQLDQSYNQIAITAIVEAIARIEEIEEMELGSLETDTEITNILDELQKELEAQNILFTELVQKDINEQRQSLEAYVAESQRLIDKRRLEADAKALADITAKLRIIGLWGIMVGLSSLAAVLMSMRSLKGYVRAVDSMLPRPIFSSVADMTRVTIWEAKRSLQIDGDMGHIQWIEATRNGTGGIDLIGLCRTEPKVDSKGNLLSTTVPAQRYVIQTNLWGRILNTRVRDVRVPPFPLPEILSQGMTASAQGIDPPPDADNLAPDPPSGDDLAQDFFNQSSTPLGTESEESSTEGVASSPSRNGQQQTAASHIRARPIPRSQPAAARREQLCQEFARILHQLLAEDEALEKEELGRLYSDIGLNYGRFPGTLLEKCQDLVTLYQRHERLSELVDICICRHHDVLWGDIFDLLDD